MSAPFSSARRIIIKVGSALVAEADTGAPAASWLGALAADIVALLSDGAGVVIVSSGAVALGRRALGIEGGALSLAEKQACAAAGQTRLMRAWEAAFEPFGRPVAQALLTPDDTERRRRWLNARATLETLIAAGAIPVVNENDTVATQELRYGDNDRLAARVAQMISADVLVLLSDVDGLYTADPRRDPAARHIPAVALITPEIEAMAGGANAVAGVGSGGMRTKIEAAKIAADAGCRTILMHGAEPRPLSRLAAGARHTLFAARATPQAAYKAWISGSLAPKGVLHVDAGAATALASGKSLLPAGVTAIEGRFEKGDAVAIVGPDGGEIARGLARYDGEDAARIKGLKSDAIEAALGYAAGPVLVHADDLVRR
jgi:glutamate 5-kinase